MSTYARIVSGYAADVQVASSIEELEVRYHPDYIVGKEWVVVPDGTKGGAKDNGDGTFTNPAEPEPPAAPQSELSQILARLDAIEAAISP